MKGENEVKHRGILNRQYDLHETKESTVPEKGIRKFLYLLVNETGRLIILNLVFVLSCLPVITIPAAVCALDHVLFKMIRKGYGYDLSDYFTELRAELVKSLPVGAACGVLLFYGYYLLSFAVQMPERAAGYFRFAALACCIAAVLAGSYCFAILSLFDMKVSSALKNAVWLSLYHWKQSGTVLLLTAAFAAFVFLLMPLSGICMVIIGCAVYHLVLCITLRPVLEKHAEAGNTSDK